MDAHPDVPVLYPEAEVPVQRPSDGQPFQVGQLPSGGHPAQAYCVSDASDDVRPDALEDGYPSGRPALHQVHPVHLDEGAGILAVHEPAIPFAAHQRSALPVAADAEPEVQARCKPAGVLSAA